MTLSTQPHVLSAAYTYRLTDVPCATYRLQFNGSFTFADAKKIIPYLHLLGISHIYASPFFKARAGSPHGYDIVDHNAFNPEIGDEASFTDYVKTLHEHGMGQLLDIVPNHMGVGGDDNPWWLNVLENGEASPYAPHFDIDWHPVNPALQNEILLPFLRSHYGVALEQGALTLTLDPQQGAFGVRYHEHLFPIDPRTYPFILTHRINLLKQSLTLRPAAFEAFIALVTDCRLLPRRTELSATQRRRRQHGIADCKRRLADLYRDVSEIENFVNENITYFNGITGQPKSFDPLHRLLEAQAYRLAYWQVASDEINYRRFFDINELAGIRMENREAFNATHHLVRQLIRDGQINGLRIDHADGLSDPYHYFIDLQKMIRDTLANQGELNQTAGYLLIEKILADNESLRADWPVAGTTGYETAYLLNGLFIYPGTERVLSQLYCRFTGLSQNFDDRLYDCKKQIIHSALASELTVLTNLVSNIAQTNRFTRDFTYQGLRHALAEVVACFPIYRTYVTQQRFSEEDHRAITWAIAQAKQRSPAADTQIFTYIHALLTRSRCAELSASLRAQVVQFILRFQQYSAPVMAKGMEDTAGYVYNRLVSLNDVGFDPRRFGLSIKTFHSKNQRRLADWPHAMVSTSTHDSKRSEDVRARINVLSEQPQKWRQHLARWSRATRSNIRIHNKFRAPSRNDEYLLYQTLLGTWPLETLDASGLENYRARIESYMLKAIKEAKLHTSWINPDEEYESAMKHFVQALLTKPARNAFLADFIPFQADMVRFGLYNSLSQTLLKLTVPGVPDIYQGNETWSFQLVDPDNRRPVDYRQCQIALQAIIERANALDRLSEYGRELLERIEDGHAKLYLTWRALQLRRKHPELFIEGDYTEMDAEGDRADHICAFSRRWQNQEIIVVSSRWFAGLVGEPRGLPIGDAIWNNTWVLQPREKNHARSDPAQGERYRNVLTHEALQPMQTEAGVRFHTADLFRHFPVALLIKE